jgi:hypothetical protein
VIVKQLDGIMHAKDAGHPQKLAAWLSASNIQQPSAGRPPAAPPASPKPQIS